MRNSPLANFVLTQFGDPAAARGDRRGHCRRQGGTLTKIISTWSADMKTEADEANEMEAALTQVPRGALALAGTAVGLLMLAWFVIYLFVFLPRGQVG